jgi:hypothetical protein
MACGPNDGMFKRGSELSNKPSEESFTDYKNPDHPIHSHLTLAQGALKNSRAPVEKR